MTEQDNYIVTITFKFGKRTLVIGPQQWIVHENGVTIRDGSTATENVEQMYAACVEDWNDDLVQRAIIFAVTALVG